MTPPISRTFLRRQVVAPMTKNENAERFHVRKNPRLGYYDYSKPNYYFVTVCTSEKEWIFGDAGNLNPYGKIAEQGLLKVAEHFPNVVVDKYVIMPNHIHAVLILKEQAANLSVILGQYKSYVARQIHQIEPDRKVWQTSFHDHVIRNQKEYEKIWLYIDSNPVNWEKDCFFEK